MSLTWEEQLAGGAHGTTLWRRVPLAEWYDWEGTWWWWTEAEGIWQRAGGDKEVRYYKGGWWVAYAWVPPPEHLEPATGELEMTPPQGR